MTTADATRIAGDAYRTRLAHDSAAVPENKTRIAQEGYQSRLARDDNRVQPNASEQYKIGERIVDRYEVSAIHHGEMGVVYGCYDHQTKLPRALKTIRARHVLDNNVLSMFESEAAVWISLEKHPNIVRAYSVERFNDLPYVVTEYVRGPEGMEGDLRGWLGHPRLTLPVAVAMALQIAQGMQHAVQKVPNLVHRDLKPGNILVNGDGKAMVSDFGLVHANQYSAGTPAYMSPEQWRSDVLDLRTDIYAYGCVLFEMFTAHRLFPALSESEWERAHLDSVPATLSSIAPSLPGEIDLFVRRCLAKDPAARPQSWDEAVSFFAEWYHRLTGKAVVFDFSTLVLDDNELYNAGWSFSNLNRNDDALNIFDRSIESNPKSAHAWYCKGVTLGKLSRQVEELDAYEMALAIDPDYRDAWYNKGNVLFYLRRYDEAVLAWGCTIAADPDYVSAWFNKGIALAILNRFPEAIQAYEGTLAIDPKHGGAWCNKGIALAMLSRNPEAITAYEMAIKIDPRLRDAWSGKGVALANLDRYAEAIPAYEKALSIAPAYLDAWCNKGVALGRVNRHEEAVSAFEAALAIDPQYDIALQGKKYSLSMVNHKTNPRPWFSLSRLLGR
jgi:serine/threonine protein kinase